ncbi:MAG: hypothetical protein ACOCQR_01085 [bacterium]
MMVIGLFLVIVPKYDEYLEGYYNITYSSFVKNIILGIASLSISFFVVSTFKEEIYFFDALSFMLLIKLTLTAALRITRLLIAMKMLDMPINLQTIKLLRAEEKLEKEFNKLDHSIHKLSAKIKKVRETETEKDSFSLETSIVLLKKLSDNRNRLREEQHNIKKKIRDCQQHKKITDLLRLSKKVEKKTPTVISSIEKKINSFRIAAENNKSFKEAEDMQLKHKAIENLKKKGVYGK